MRQWTKVRNQQSIVAGIRRLAARLGLAGCGLSVAGCVVVGGAAAAAATVLLTGWFVGALQASFAATAHSYAYTDTGSVQFVFAQTTRHSPQLVAYTGRLPGFYFVVIDDDVDKAIPRQANGDRAVFATDVYIDFETSPPTVTGTISEIGGEQVLALTEVFPDIRLTTPQITETDDDGGYDMRLSIEATDADGGELEYALILHARLNSTGNALEATVEVERVFTPVDQDPIVIEGEGQLSDVTKVSDSQLPPANENDNTAEEPADENDNAEELNENEEDPTDDESGDEGEGEEPEEDGEEEPEEEPEDATGQPTTPAECIADLSILPSHLVTDIEALLAAGQSEFDLDENGTVTAAEVQQRISDAIADTGFAFPIVIPDENAQCAADLMNE